MDITNKWIEWIWHYDIIKGIDGTNLKEDPEKLKLVEQVVQEENVVEVCEKTLKLSWVHDNTFWNFLPIENEEKRGVTK